MKLRSSFHSLVLDGVYEVTGAGPTRFHPLPPPDDEEVARVVVATARRLARLLEARGLGLHTGRALIPWGSEPNSVYRT